MLAVELDARALELLYECFCLVVNPLWFVRAGYSPEFSTDRHAVATFQFSYVGSGHKIKKVNKWMLATVGSYLFGLFGVQRPPRQIHVVRGIHRRSYHRVSAVCFPHPIATTATRATRRTHAGIIQIARHAMIYHGDQYRRTGWAASFGQRSQPRTIRRIEPPEGVCCGGDVFMMGGLWAQRSSEIAGGRPVYRERRARSICRTHQHLQCR